MFNIFTTRRNSCTSCCMKESSVSHPKLLACRKTVTHETPFVRLVQHSYLNRRSLLAFYILPSATKENTDKLKEIQNIMKENLASQFSMKLSDGISLTSAKWFLCFLARKKTQFSNSVTTPRCRFTLSVTLKKKSKRSLWLSLLMTLHVERFGGKYNDSSRKKAKRKQTKINHQLNIIKCKAELLEVLLIVYVVHCEADVDGRFDGAGYLGDGLRRRGYVVRVDQRLLLLLLLLIVLRC
ncbi:hypothetical protein ALC53_03370 [Atta colombica]|uniref:Uncharacterized protein n=1 Tax=Atta colombica TaxID=520822 RepID=A0A195BPA2_9HYME|nr:hypothetical protein ALC53_03370 [Atta colombica]